MIQLQDLPSDSLRSITTEAPLNCVILNFSFFNFEILLFSVLFTAHFTRIIKAYYQYKNSFAGILLTAGFCRNTPDIWQKIQP